MKKVARSAWGNISDKGGGRIPGSGEGMHYAFRIPNWNSLCREGYRQ